MSRNRFELEKMSVYEILTVLGLSDTTLPLPSMTKYVSESTFQILNLHNRIIKDCDDIWSRNQHGKIAPSLRAKRD